MSSPRVTFNLTYGKGVTELQNLANICLSSFAESHQMQQKNFDVSPKLVTFPNIRLQWVLLENSDVSSNDLFRFPLSVNPVMGRYRPGIVQ